jgi:hypothetical protein
MFAVAAGKGRRRLVRFAVTAAVAAGVAFAQAGGSGIARPAFHAKPLTRAFRILRGPRVAAVEPAPAQPLTGATATDYAASEADGSKLFAATLADGELCLIDQEPSVAPAASATATRTGSMSVACGSASAAEQDGVGLVFPAGGGYPAVAAVLVPDGVTSVSFELQGGGAVDEPVSNNVAWYSSTRLAGVAFTMPGGARVSTSTSPSG